MAFLGISWNMCCSHACITRTDSLHLRVGYSSGSTVLKSTCLPSTDDSLQHEKVHDHLLFNMHSWFLYSFFYLQCVFQVHLGQGVYVLKDHWEAAKTAKRKEDWAVFVLQACFRDAAKYYRVRMPLKRTKEFERLRIIRVEPPYLTVLSGTGSLMSSLSNSIFLHFLYWVYGEVQAILTTESHKCPSSYFEFWISFLYSPFSRCFSKSHIRFSWKIEDI